MAISFVQSAVAGGSTTVSLSGVTAGNIVIVAVTAGDNSGTWTVSDGTGNLTALTRVVETYGTAAQLFYTLNARSGNRTYTVPQEESVMSLCAMEFSCAGTSSLKAENGAWSDDTGSISSGNVSASGSCLVLGTAISLGGGNWSSLRIAGTAADGYKSYIDSTGWAPTWYRIGSSGISGAATATWEPYWACAVLAIEESSGAQTNIPDFMAGYRFRRA